MSGTNFSNHYRADLVLARVIGTLPSNTVARVLLCQDIGRISELILAKRAKSNAIIPFNLRYPYLKRGVPLLVSKPLGIHMFSV